MQSGLTVLTDALMTMLQKKLDLPPQESILSDVAIIELGVDSLVAVDIRSWFSNELEHDIPIIRILGGATLADLVEDAITTLSPEIAPNLVRDSQEDEPRSADDHASPDKPVTPPADLSSSNDETSDSNDADTPDTAATSTDVEDGSESSAVLVKVTKMTGGHKTASSAPVRTRAFVRIEKMTYACSRFWFLRQYLDDSNCFNVVIAFRMVGEVDINRAQEAVRKLSARHEVLRTAFYAGENGEPLMGVMADSLLRLEVETISQESEATDAWNALSQHKFDIEQGEVVRIRLLSLSPRDHTFIFSAHHIAMDGFSFNLVFREFNMLYQDKPLLEPSTQFADFAVQQRRDVETGRMRDDVAFWKKTFKTIPDPLPLFSFANVKARTPMVKYEHEEVEVVLDLATAQRIRALCRQQRCTMFHFFLATLQVLLTQWLETDDLCIGIADANRKDVKTLSTLGCLLNLVPLRFNTPHDKASFSSILASAKQTVYSSLAHSAAPFELLLEELNVPRSSSHSPLFQAFLDYRQVSLKTLPLLESRAEGESKFGATAYDIVLDVTDPASHDITIKWQTQKSLYSHEHARIMVDSYMRLLRYFVNNVAAEIGTAPLYKAEDVADAIEVGRGK
jgi:hybrid polyketide synthase/nonribosomal peptide synthetase ACE1